MVKMDPSEFDNGAKREIPYLNLKEHPKRERTEDFLFSNGNDKLIGCGQIQTYIRRGEKYGSLFGLSLVKSSDGSMPEFVRPTKAGMKVLWIDTRHSETYLRQIAKSVVTEEAFINGRIKILPLWRYTYEDRLNLTKATIKSYKPDFVLIDSVEDLCYEYWALSKESKNVVHALLNLADEIDCAILCTVLFGSIEADGDNLGTEIYYKSCETYKGIKREKSIIVTQSGTRFKPIRDLKFPIL